jgi:hypothetical protein
MLARDLDCRLGSPLGRIELASKILQSSGPCQGEGDAPGVCEAVAESQSGLHPLHGSVGKAAEPKRPCRIQSARDARAIRVEQNVGGILPSRDRIVNRDAFVQLSGRIGKPAKEEQRRP